MGIEIEGHWEEVKIRGYVADVYVPPQLNPHHYALIYLHGVHLVRLLEKPAFSQEFARHGFPVVAPRTGRSWWTNRICPDFDPEITAERYVVQDVVRYVTERFSSSPGQIGLFGTSMGGQGALRLGFLHPNLFPVVAGISPAIDFQHRFREPEEETLPEMYPDAESARQDTATLHVHPLNWPRNIWFCCDPADHRWFDSSQKLKMKLDALGIPHAHELEVTAGGHGWGYYDRMAPAAIEFLWNRLEQERRRVA